MLRGMDGAEGLRPSQLQRMEKKNSHSRDPSSGRSVQCTPFFT